MDKKIKILYLLNLSKDEQFMRNLSHDSEAWNTYISVAMRVPSDWAEASVIGKYIAKGLKTIFLKSLKQ